MNHIRNMAPLKIAQWCLANKIVPLPLNGKAPTVTDWPAFRVAAADLPQHFSGDQQNIGALLGAASQGLVDVDLDWPECEQLVIYFLPRSWCFGRRDDAGQFHPRHVMLRCPEISNRDWKAPAKVFSKPLSVVQVLSQGKQVMLPGSLHADSGQTVEWRDKPASNKLVTIGADDLLRAVNRMAGTALLVRLWPDLEGSRHDVALALAGACHHAGWSFEDVANMGTALLTVAHDTEKRDRIRAMQTTLQRAADGQAVTGLPKLSELLPGDVVMCLQKWWGLGEQQLQLTVNGQPLEDAATASTGNSATGNTWSQDWPELLEIETIPASTAEYPMAALGSVMQAAAQELVQVQKVPDALAAQSVLSVASGAAQPHFDAVLDGRRIPLSLWLTLIAVAGERKTSTDRRARQRTETRLREALIEWRITYDAWVAAKRDKEQEAGPRPREPTWLLTKVNSMQGMMKQLENNSPHMLLSAADAGSWFGGYSMRDGRAAETMSVLSDVWSGEMLSTALASQENATEMFNRRLSMSFMLQPKVAADLFDTELARNQGFLSRCLPAFPNSRIGQRMYQAPGAMPALDRYLGAIDELLQQRPDMCLETGELTTRDITLSADAYRLWVQAHNEIENAMAPGQRYADVVEVANKGPEQALRLAAVRTALDGKTEIDVDAMSGGVVLMRFYLDEWLTIAGRLRAHSGSVGDLAKLWEWLVHRRDHQGHTTFNLRDAYRVGPRVIRNQSVKAKLLVGELIQRGYVRMTGHDYEIRPADKP